MIQKININQIVASPKVYRKGVEKFKEMIIRNEKIKPLVVIKHPEKDLYAVLDGHHRFYAFLESGITEIECSVIKLPSFLFTATAKGWQQLLVQFKEYPEKLLEASKKPFIKLKPYSARFEFDEKIPIKKRKDFIKWLNSSIKKMKLEKEVDKVEVKVDSCLEDLCCDFDETFKRIDISFPENILNKIDGKLISHYIGYINEVICGLKLEKVEKQPEMIKEAVKEIVAISVDGKLEKKNLPHITRQERKKFFKQFLKKFKLEIDREKLNRVIKRFWGKRVESEKGAIEEAKKIVETLKKEE